jgi:hypothetical protein
MWKQVFLKNLGQENIVEDTNCSVKLGNAIHILQCLALYQLAYIRPIR